MAEEKKCPYCGKPMTRLTKVDKKGKETKKWICLSYLCKLEREMEDRRAA